MQFTYLYPKVRLLDTTGSAPGYNFVEEGKEYPVRDYEFNNSEDVGQYWVDLALICGDTPLGKMCQKRPEEMVRSRIYDVFRGMIKCATIAVPGSEPDIGKPMGNSKGAAGFDSIIMAHLKKSWQWKAGAEKLYSSDQEKYLQQHWKKNGGELISGKKGRLPRLTQRTELAEVSAAPQQKYLVLSPTGQSSTHATAPQNLSPGSRVYTIPVETRNTKDMKQTRGGKGRKRKPVTRRGLDDGPLTKKKREADEATWLKKKKEELEQKRLKKLKKKEEKKAIDQVDILAAQRMNRLRVLWTAKEDSMLLLTKVASLFMNPHLPKFILPWSVVRDILHEISPASHDKTSKACARRVLYMMKNPQTKNNVSVVLGEALQDQDLVREFKSKKYHQTEKDFESNKKAFRGLFYRLKNKFESMLGAEKYELPETLLELHARHTLNTAGKLPEKSEHKDVASKRDIQASVLHNIVQSSCGTVDKVGRQYMMYRVYSQYSDDLLSSVLNTMRHDNIISKKKKASTHDMLSFLSSRTYHISQRFFNKFQVFPYRSVIFPEAISYLLQLNSEVASDFSAVNTGGGCAAFVTLLTLGKISYEIKVPERIIDVETKRSAVAESPNKDQPDASELEGQGQSCQGHSGQGQSDQGLSDQGQSSQGQSSQGHSAGDKPEKVSGGPMRSVSLGVKGGSDAEMSISSLQKKEVRFAPDPVYDANRIAGETRDKTPQSPDLSLVENPVLEQQQESLNEGTSEFRDLRRSSESTTINDRVTSMLSDQSQIADTAVSIPTDTSAVSMETGTSAVFMESGTSAVSMEMDTGALEAVSMETDCGILESQLSRTLELDESSLMRTMTATDEDEEGEEDNLLTMNDNDDDVNDDDSDPDYVPEGFQKRTKTRKGKSSAKLPAKGKSNKKKAARHSNKEFHRIQQQRRWENKMKERDGKPSHKRNTVLINMEQLFFHSHIRPLKPTDTIVLRSCSILTKLKPCDSSSIPSEQSQKTEDILSSEIIKSIRKTQMQYIPKSVDFQSFRQILTERADLSKEDIENVAIIYWTIEGYKDLGITWVELKKLVGNLSRFSQLLSILLEDFLILKVGVTVVRYVCRAHGEAWVTHSFRNLKGRGAREYALQGAEDSASEGTAKQPHPNDDQSSSAPAGTTQDQHEEETETNELSDLQSQDDEGNVDEDVASSPTVPEIIQNQDSKPSVTKRTPATRTSRLSRLREMDRVRQQAHASMTLDPVDLISRPWKKPEGGLNRTMFKKMIEGVMLFILSHPGSKREDIYKKFNPILQPVVALELLEILEMTGCVTKIILKKTKPTVFSKQSAVSTAPEDNGDENVYYNPTLECIIKLSILTEQI